MLQSMAALRLCNGLAFKKDSEEDLMMKNILRIWFEKNIVSSQRERIDALYPKDWWDLNWDKISNQSADCLNEIYHQSLFEVIELNSPDLKNFRTSCAQALKELKNPTSDLHVPFLSLNYCRLFYRID